MQRSVSPEMSGRVKPAKYNKPRHHAIIMKKFLLPLSALLTVAASAGAVSFKSGPFTFETTGDTTVTLSKADSKDASGAKITSYTVPQTVMNNEISYTVTAIGQEAFRWSYATQIDLPSTIVTLGASAFNGSSDLAVVTLPDGLKTIGDYAFSSTALTSLDIPASVESIGVSAFFTCKSLSDITFHSGLKTIGASAFYKTALTDVVLPESLVELGDKAFLYCDKLTSIKLPSTLKALGTGTFMQCSSLTSVSIPEGVTSIGLECFLHTALSEISIPSTVESIGTSAFACTSITSISLGAGNSSFVLIDGVLYDAAQKLLYAVPCKGKTSVDVSAKCIGINGGAFWGSEVSKVTLPEGVLAIDDYAFCQSALAEINFPSSLTYIGEQGFADTKLTDVTLPENMPYVYDGAFAGCKELTSVTIPSGVKLIFNHAFHNDTKLASVTCLGSVAPEIDDVYETYDSPFYGISETTPCYIPKGSLSSYQDAGWASYFKLVESETAPLATVSITPADGTVLGKYADMRVEIEFASEVSVVNATPEVYLRKGSELSGVVVGSDGGWRVNMAGKNSIRVWSDDGDGYTQTFSPEQDAEYYLIIPAGIVKSADGALNERIVIKWTGPAAPKPLEVVSITPADGSTLPTGYFNMKFLITFADDITIIDYGPDACLRESDAVDGKEIAPDLGWKATKENDNTLNLWASDYDYCVQSFKVNDAIVYYMTIPAGIVQNAAGDKNEEIIIELKGATSGIDGIAAENDVIPVEHYDLTGRIISADAKGLHIVRMSDGSARKIMVK